MASTAPGHAERTRRVIQAVDSSASGTMASSGGGATPTCWHMPTSHSRASNWRKSAYGAGAVGPVGRDGGQHVDRAAEHEQSPEPERLYQPPREWVTRAQSEKDACRRPPGRGRGPSRREVLREHYWRDHPDRQRKLHDHQDGELLPE